MPKPPQQLINFWYKKLKETGFEDIEQSGLRNPDKNENYLKTWASADFKNVSKETFESTREYYQLAGKFLHDHKFKNNFHKLIWKYHCEGIYPKDMRPMLAKEGHHQSRIRIYKILEELRKVMLSDFRQK